jgi:hypothetical protein
MIKKHYISIFFLAIVILLICSGFRTKENSFVQYEFAFNLAPSYNTQLVSFAIVATKDGRVINKRYISESSFIRQVAGLELSKANPDQIDLFEKYELTDCFYKYDSIKDLYVDGYNCFRITDLWALKYGRNPLCPGDCIPTEDMLVKGWAAQNSRPSWPQLQILQKYGVIYVDDMFHGENMFQLFSDMKDSKWINTYVNAGRSNDNRSKS